ncbi:hypothetical protein [Arthrobacter nitrophenolicus]|uniref:hypothetical protein n=1 Tax=Arthrobacter nitrophenolicus TaxID=683150 RepID=UPI001F4033C0|nr:hypothetical protein [Arthrobacter nitrophenolicus]
MSDTPAAGTFSMTRLAAMSLTGVPAGTASFTTRTSRGSVEARARWSAPLA